MPDAFAVRRKIESEGDDILDDLQARRRDAQEEVARKKRLVDLKMGTYFFDPLTREILRRVGKKYVFMRHDRRHTHRLSAAEAESGAMRLIQGGLFLDTKTKAVYQFRAGHYVLYSRDRRKTAGKSPGGQERRKAR